MAGIHNISWNDLTLRSNTAVPLTNPQMDDNFLIAKTNIDILYDWIGEVNDDSNELYRRLQYGQGGLSNLFFTGDQFKALETAFNNLNTSNGIVNQLGFTPVQQGGITGYGNNKISIGWSTATSGPTQNKLLLNIDSTNFLQDWPINSASTSSVNWTNVQNRPTNISTFTNDQGYLTKNDVGFEYISWSEEINVSTTTYDTWANIKSWSIDVPVNKTLALINSTTYVYIAKNGTTSFTKTLEFRILVNGGVIGHGYISPDPNVDNDLVWCVPIQGVSNNLTTPLSVSIQCRVSDHNGSAITNGGRFNSSNGPMLSEVKIIWM